MKFIGFPVCAFILALLAVPQAMAGDPAAACAAAKQKAAGKKAASKLGCYAKATKKSQPVDPTCVAKAEQKFASAFDKAEAKGGCVTTSDTTTVEGAVDSFVTNVVNALPATTTSTTMCLPEGSSCAVGSTPCCSGLRCCGTPLHCGGPFDLSCNQPG